MHFFITILLYNRVLGTIVTYSCITGYSSSDPLVLDCVAFNSTNGIWNGTTPTCQIIDNFCPVLSFPDGSFTQSLGHFNDSVAFNCSSGYILTGPAVANCTEYNATAGVWTQIPTCDLIPFYCPDIQSEVNSTGGSISYYPTNLTLNAVANVTCQNGYSASADILGCVALNATVGK